MIESAGSRDGGVDECPDCRVWSIEERDRRLLLKPTAGPLFYVRSCPLRPWLNHPSVYTCEPFPDWGFEGTKLADVSAPTTTPLVAVLTLKIVTLDAFPVIE